MIGSAVTLIGPGGAGKSTVGTLLAERLGLACIDLDRRFAERYGDISDYIRRYGYDAYSRTNVATYCSMSDEPCVAALSSGFMTYPPTVHPEYARVRSEIETSPTTFVLIPSLDREQCVQETVRRQLARPFARTAVQEENVIRERFPLYMALSAPKVETKRPLDAIVQDVLSRLDASAQYAAPSSRNG
jgi:shikimate kinase